MLIYGTIVICSRGWLGWIFLDPKKEFIEPRRIYILESSRRNVFYWCSYFVGNGIVE